MLQLVFVFLPSFANFEVGWLVGWLIDMQMGTASLFFKKYCGIP
jgi:hypothetical protein